MAISMGNTGRQEVSDINMTPMIDVLLVLLVIFMIAQPLLQKSIDVQVPKNEKSQNANPAPKIVLEIKADGVYTINTQPVAKAELEPRLRQIFGSRGDRLLFIKAERDVVYQDVIGAMDAARGAGVTVLGAVL